MVFYMSLIHSKIPFKTSCRMVESMDHVYE